MKKEELYDAVGGINENMIGQALQVRRRWPIWVATAAVLVLVIGLVAAPWRSVLPYPSEDPAPPVTALAAQLGAAVYPERAQVGDEDYYEERRSWISSEPSVSAIAFADRMDILLNAQENGIYSPLSLYLALGMLAESSNGATRTEIMTLLGETDLESLRAQTQTLWNMNYQDNGAYTSLLANSLWLREGAPYSEQTVSRLAQDYFADVFAGQMGSPAYDAYMRQWINRKTGDLLADAVADKRFDEQTVVSLLSTVYLAGRWSSEFMPEQTAPDIFYGVNGEQTVDFMRQTSWQSVIRERDYTALSMAIAEGGEMMFILPNDELSDLLDRDIVSEILLREQPWETEYVDLHLPKFDVSSKIDLTDALKQMGVKTVFSHQADLSPLTAEDGFLSSATQDVRVAIDEEGVTAAALTELHYCGSALPPEPTELRVDRPFLFIITGMGDTPLFVGTVCHIG